LTITKGDFEQALVAYNGQLVALQIEEKYTLLLDNYKEFEKEMLAIGFAHLMYHEIRWSPSVAKLQNLNRLLCNVLSSCKLYLDQVRHDFSGLFGNASPEFDALKVSTNDQCDHRLGYRVGEALRNFAQHAGLPIDELRLELSKEQTSGVRKYGVTPLMNMERVRATGGFKKSVMSELSALNQKVDLKPHIRDYVDGLSAVHRTVRTQIASKLCAWEAALAGALENFEKQNGTDHGAVWLCERDNDGKVIRYVPIVPEVEDRRRELAAKTARLLVAGSIVTSEVWR